MILSANVTAASQVQYANQVKALLYQEKLGALLHFMVFGLLLIMSGSTLIAIPTHSAAALHLDHEDLVFFASCLLLTGSLMFFSLVNAHATLNRELSKLMTVTNQY